MVDVGRLAAELAGGDPIQQLIERNGLQLDLDVRVGLRVLPKDLLEGIVRACFGPVGQDNELNLVLGVRCGDPAGGGAEDERCGCQTLGEIVVADRGVMNMRLPVLSLIVMLIS